MPRTRFVKSAEEVRALLAAKAAPAFLDSHSLTVTFETDPAVIAELLPPPLEPTGDARVAVSVFTIGRSNCVGPFDGAAVTFPCTYGGESGSYCLTMPMSTDTAISFGRELYAEPKKLASIALEQRGKHVRGTVSRHGVTYLEIAGLFEDEPTPVDLASVSKRFYFRFLPRPDGSGISDDPELVCVTHHGRTRRLARGTGTVAFRESRHDPLIDIPVVSVVGATLTDGETHTRAEVVARVSADSFLPYAFQKIDDLTAWAAMADPLVV